MLPQCYVKDPGHSTKSAGGSLHLNMHTCTPLTQRSRSGMTMLLSRHSVGTYLEMSSHAACQGTGSTGPQSPKLTQPLWTDPVIKSGISVHKLISTKKKKKKCRRGMNCRTFSQTPRTRGKSHHHHATIKLGSAELCCNHTDDR